MYFTQFMFLLGIELVFWCSVNQALAGNKHNPSIIMNDVFVCVKWVFFVICLPGYVDSVFAESMILSSCMIFCTTFWLFILGVIKSLTVGHPCFQNSCIYFCFFGLLLISLSSIDQHTA